MSAGDAKINIQLIIEDINRRYDVSIDHLRKLEKIVTQCLRTEIPKDSLESLLKMIKALQQVEHRILLSHLEETVAKIDNRHVKQEMQLIMEEIRSKQAVLPMHLTKLETVMDHYLKSEEPPKHASSTTSKVLDRTQAYAAPESQKNLAVSEALEMIRSLKATIAPKKEERMHDDSPRKSHR
jgi:hypothetical protein